MLKTTFLHTLLASSVKLLIIAKWGDTSRLHFMSYDHIVQFATFYIEFIRVFLHLCDVI